MITNDQKRELITQRLQQFAAEAYQHELNRMTAEALGDSNLVEQADQALSQLRIAIAIHEQELGNL